MSGSSKAAVALEKCGWGREVGEGGGAEMRGGGGKNHSYSFDHDGNSQ